MTTNIKFARDYGWAPAAPFWLVWNENGHPPKVKHATREEAEAEAARLAASSPGVAYHVLAVTATISTSMDVVGTRYDPSRAPARVAEEDAAPPSEPCVADEEPL